MLAETMYYTPTENRANYWYVAQLNLSYISTYMNNCWIVNSDTSQNTKPFVGVVQQVLNRLWHVPVLCCGQRARLAGRHGAVQVHRELPRHCGPEETAVADIHRSSRPRLLLRLLLRHRRVVRRATVPAKPPEALAEV